MADNDFSVTMVDPHGGEFVAGSPEVVARLTAQGYTRQDSDQAATDEQEQRQAESNVSGPKDGEQSEGTIQTTGVDTTSDGPGPATPKTDTANKPAAAKTGGGAGKRS